MRVERGVGHVEMHEGNVEDGDMTIAITVLLNAMVTWASTSSLADDDRLPGIR